jgi:hypothetical protein
MGNKIWLSRCSLRPGPGGLSIVDTKMVRSDTRPLHFRRPDPVLQAIQDPLDRLDEQSE